MKERVAQEKAPNKLMRSPRAGTLNAMAPIEKEGCTPFRSKVAEYLLLWNLKCQPFAI